MEEDLKHVDIIPGGRYEIVPGFGHDGSLIFKAATTCYKNEDKTKRTPDEYIEMLKKNGHTAMLEFMWIVAEIPFEKFADIFGHPMDLCEYVQTDLGLGTTGFIDAFVLDGNIYLMGNARAFLEQLQWIEHVHNMEEKAIGPIAVDLMSVLFRLHPVLFNFPLGASVNSGRIRIVKEGEDIFRKYPFLDWQMVILRNVSRGLTHEAVRHRVMSFAQTSTRYVSMADTSVVFPMDEIPEDKRSWTRHVIESSLALYEDLVKSGVTKNTARQILPTGICADLCIAGTMRDWHHLLELRTAKDAHWEIRTIMTAIENDPEFFCGKELMI